MSTALALEVGVLILANASSVIISRWAAPWLINRYGGVYFGAAQARAPGGNGNDGPNDEPDPGLGQGQVPEDPNEENEEDEGQNV